MNPELKKRIQIVQNKAEKAAAEWLKENEGNIESKIRNLLDKRLKEIVCKLLGFDNGWCGRWEVDHCNGRKGESAAGDWLRWWK